MPDHRQVYQSESEKYERLIAREDKFGNILKAIQEIIYLGSSDVVETGAGTGRLTCLLAPHVRSLRAYDISPAMLEVARQKLDEIGLQQVVLGTADHRCLPVADQSADLVISGWSVCYLVDWDLQGWQAEVEKALLEFSRILRPNGVIMLLETLGTGYKSPHPPDHLVDYYAFLRSHGFSRKWIRTDYRFDSVEEAVELSIFFFGEGLAKQVQAAGSRILPECTGIWWK